MRRVLLAAVVAAASFGASAPATAYECVGAEKVGINVGACAGTWCPDACFIVAFTYCGEDINHRICDLVRVGNPPGGGR